MKSDEESKSDLAQFLVEHSPSGVLVTGDDGRLLMANPAVRQVVPVVPDALGRMPIDAVPIPTIAEALDPNRTDELEFALKTGNKDLLVRVRPHGSGGGRVAWLHDVTRLRAAERVRSEFVANVSHELRTPATSIAGYAETLLQDRETLDPFVVDMVEVIHRNAQRLVALFEDILHLSKLDAREGPLPLMDLSVARVVQEAIDKNRGNAEEKNMMVQAFIPPELVATANPEGLRHVIANLIENGIKYSHMGGIVTVRATEKNDRVRVEVIDVGFGIDPAHHERIFERFYRVDKGRSREQGGTGLGLSIVKHLCRAMNAEITVKSRPGKGSVFRVELLPAGRANIEGG